MTVLVTGALGQLGRRVCAHLEKDNIAHVGVDLNDCDLVDEKQVDELFQRVRPDTVIHCAAYTAVDKAETDKERCFAVNQSATANVADACAKAGVALLYVSTDYVFDGSGETPWETTDTTGPLNVYGESKLAGEREVMARLQRFFIVRTTWVFGVDGGNFVKTMLRLGGERTEVRVVRDQFASPTYADDLAALLSQMIQTDKYGVYHATNEGFCSCDEFARKIFELVGIICTVVPVTTEEYGAAARRPKNSRLSKRSLYDNGFDALPGWENALERCLTALDGDRVKGERT